MNWKFVFNTTVGDKTWGHVGNARKAAEDCGYKFFTWNGRVYNIDGHDTGILVDDLK